MIAQLDLFTACNVMLLVFFLVHVAAAVTWQLIYTTYANCVMWWSIIFITAAIFYMSYDIIHSAMNR